jgi:hypothetical protein
MFRWIQGILKRILLPTLSRVTCCAGHPKAYESLYDIFLPQRIHVLASY